MRHPEVTKKELKAKVKLLLMHVYNNTKDFSALPHHVSITKKVNELKLHPNYAKYVKIEYLDKSLLIGRTGGRYLWVVDKPNMKMIKHLIGIVKENKREHYIVDVKKFKPWSEDDKKLEILYKANNTIHYISIVLNRSRYSVSSRVSLLRNKGIDLPYRQPPKCLK